MTARGGRRGRRGWSRAAAAERAPPPAIGAPASRPAAAGGRARQLREDAVSGATGKVVSVRGAVVDVSFETSVVPPINTALIVDWDRPEPLVLEVHSHVDPATVRGIALQATAGSGARHAGARDRCAHFGAGRRRGARAGCSTSSARCGTAGPPLPADTPAARHPQPAAGARRTRPRPPRCSRPASR